ncbi:flagellar hook-length control protein FliK [Natroniella acetigena]|uniref:flagellar hook-length control protein FliK n=1 Tax=Natroniella acetigena TaxID=52004 RepID=UPI00200B57A4|nr:flagellar hook-length control protein FliK [Natroniella acetigena]MCK8826894.1 flagellar hook-length control protein FliK [Natroniella acetigena]
MTKIKETSTLKQYNPNYSKKSNLIDKKTKKITLKNLTTSEIITHLSLENNKLNKVIIQELLRLNSPLKKESIIRLNQFLTQFTETKNQNLTDKIKTALLLKELKFPLNDKFYNLFKDQINLTNNLKNSFIKLLKQLNQTDSDFNFLEKEHNNSEKNNQTIKIDILAKKTKNLLEETIISADNLSSKSISNSITNLHLNNDHTANLLKSLFKFTQSSSETINEGGRLLKQLTSLQAINHLNDNVSIFLPILLQNNLTLAQIKINKENTKEHQQNSNNTNNPLTFSIHLETEKLGLIKASIKIEDKKIWGQFKSDQPETVELINKRLDKFKVQLENNSYQVRSLTSNFTTANSNPTQQPKLTTINLTI